MQAIRFIKPIAFVLSGRNHHELNGNRLQQTGSNSLPFVSSCHTTAMSDPRPYYHFCLLSKLNDEDEINSFDDSFHLAEPDDDLVESKNVDLTVSISGFIVVPKYDLQAMLKALPDHIDATRQELGCIMFSVEQDQINQYIFHVKEKFEDMGAYNFHQERMVNSNWGEVARNVERNYFLIKQDTE